MTALPAASLPPNRFKQGLREGRRQPGLWLTLESPNATEILAGLGYDWLLLDMEHTTLGMGQVGDHIRAAKGGTAELVVRVPWNEPVLLKRLLDAGLRNVMIPFCQSAEEARRAVAATRYPPDGIRGFAGGSRASLFGRIADYAAQARHQICVIVQIESPVGIAAIEEIGAVDGIDGLFIGPNDLAANMGFLGQTRAPAVQAAIASACAAIRRTGKAAGMLDYDPAEARRMFELGFSFVAVASDASLMTGRGERLLAEMAGS